MIITFGVIQFWRIDQTNPPVDPALNYTNLNQAPAEVVTLLKNACYDCHSHETVYPWYANVAPVSWSLEGHINHARGELNFSEWGTYSEKKADHKKEEIVEMLEEKKMPLEAYVDMHEEADLSEEERKALIDWFNK